MTLKRDEITNPDSCLNKAADNEPVFVFRGKDPAAPFAIRRWCFERVRLGLNKESDPKIQAALDVADSMTFYRRDDAFGGKG